MSLLSPLGLRQPLIIFETERLYARVPLARDFEAWAAARAASRSFLQPWEPTWPDDDLTREAYRQRLRRYQTEMRAERAMVLFLFARLDHRLLGGITLSNIRRGVAQMATLGYWMAEAEAGRGLMSEAVGELIDYCFQAMRLHRLEAACLPENQRSIRLLQAQGFSQEGTARRYLQINGVWRDHLLWSLVDGDQRPLKRDQSTRDQTKRDRPRSTG
jgi:ribosomal-protein-alanine N-acetyltransferase